MRVNSTSSLLIVVVLLGALAACGQPQAPAVPASATKPLAAATPTSPLANQGPLAAGLALQPAGSSDVSTNWTGVKRQLGAAEISSSVIWPLLPVVETMLASDMLSQQVDIGVIAIGGNYGKLFGPSV